MITAHTEALDEGPYERNALHNALPHVWCITENHVLKANLESNGSKMEQHLYSETSLHLAILASRARGTFYP